MSLDVFAIATRGYIDSNSQTDIFQIATRGYLLTQIIGSSSSSGILIPSSSRIPIFSSSSLIPSSSGPIPVPSSSIFIPSSSQQAASSSGVVLMRYGDLVIKKMYLGDCEIEEVYMGDCLIHKRRKMY